MTSINLSEPVTIKANFDDWETDQLFPGNRLYSKHVARAGFQISNFHFGATKHLYYYLRFSQDTARLHYEERNNISSNNKSTFDLYLKANNAEAEGFYIGYDFAWNDLTIHATLSYLDLQDLYYGEAIGFFDPKQTLDNRTELVIDYVYPEDRIFDREVEPPKGTGITLDINARYQHGPHSIEAFIGEAFSDLYWNTAPGSLIEGNLSSLMDKGGDAAIRFQHFRSRLHQKLPIHADIHYRYRLNRYVSAGVEYETLRDKQWTKWAADIHITNNWTGSIHWNEKDSIVGIEISHPYFVFAIESDSSDYEKSHYLKLQLALRYVYQ